MSERIATEVDGVALTLSNLDKPLFPNGFTKGELISYYVEVADAMLPTSATAPSPASASRTEPATSPSSRRTPGRHPDWVSTMDVATSAGTVSYVVADDRATLAWLANLAAVELHTPQWRGSDASVGGQGVILDGDHEPRATTLMIDLDAGPGITLPTPRAARSSPLPCSPRWVSRRSRRRRATRGCS
ncbi:non-homologous end-joining DNA ligase LigD [Tessaracoccus coleopterorum]|uniref:non-homologous end-joining DNA ligase LigD n=1 Tax=Tessaracoccus coleopterorum TaxID=2714950 RepID=UPI0018D47A01|nr:hypothetical protein [Tessaracoccus coleopterorum]